MKPFMPIGKALGNALSAATENTSQKPVLLNGSFHAIHCTHDAKGSKRVNVAMRSNNDISTGLDAPSTENKAPCLLGSGASSSQNLERLFIGPFPCGGRVAY